MDSELYSIIKSGDATAFQDAIKSDENATFQKRTKRNDTVLHVACKHGRDIIVESILSLRPEMVNAANVYGETPMHVTCMCGHLQAMKVLMRCDVLRVGDLDNHGRSSLYMACYYNRVSLVECLVENRWMHSEEDGGLCLRVATSRGHGGIVRILLGAHPTLALTSYDDGNTLLHVALSNKFFEIAEYLINNTSLDVNARNAIGKTALDTVAEFENHTLRSRIVHKLLLDKQQTTIHSPKTRSDQSLPDYPSSDEQLDRNEEENYDLNEHKLKSMKRRKSLKKLHEKQQSKTREHKRIYEEGLQNARNTVVIVAVLIATVAFTAGLNPPGGVYQGGPQICESVLAKKMAFKVFMVSNRIALFASLGIVMVHVSVIPFKTKPLLRILKYSHRVMWVAVVFVAMAFGAASWATLPIDHHPHEKDGTRWMRVVLLVVAIGSLGTVFLGYSVMLGTHLKRKCKWRRERIPDRKKQWNGNNQDEEGGRDLKRRLEAYLYEGSSISDVASSSELGYHPV